MFNCVLVDNTWAVGYVIRASHMQNILQLRASKIFKLTSAILQPRLFDIQLYFHALVLLEYKL